MRSFTAQEYIAFWKAAEDGSSSYPPHSVYEYVTAPYPQMGKSNAALYTAIRVLEELHGWKMDIRNIVWDVPTFIERRAAMRRWEIELPDEMQRNAGNRSWQTEDNAIVGEELETGSFEHKHCLMTVPSKHRLDKLIADVCTSQMVIDRTDVHNQISYTSIYSLERGQLDRTAQERTPKLGTLTIGKCPIEYWSEYLRAKTDYFEKKRKVNLENAKRIETEANQVRSQLTADMIEGLLLDNEDKLLNTTGKFSVTRARVWLKDKGYGDVPFWRAQQGAAQATEHRRLKDQMERAEAVA